MLMDTSSLLSHIWNHLFKGTRTPMASLNLPLYYCPLGSGFQLHSFIQFLEFPTFPSAKGPLHILFLLLGTLSHLTPLPSLPIYSLLSFLLSAVHHILRP